VSIQLYVYSYLTAEEFSYLIENYPLKREYFVKELSFLAQNTCKILVVVCN